MISGQSAVGTVKVCQCAQFLCLFFTKLTSFCAVTRVTVTATALLVRALMLRDGAHRALLHVDDLDFLLRALGVHAIRCFTLFYNCKGVNKSSFRTCCTFLWNCR